jgi:hypothetical protein
MMMMMMEDWMDRQQVWWLLCRSKRSMTSDGRNGLDGGESCVVKSPVGFFVPARYFNRPKMDREDRKMNVYDDDS